MNTKISKGLKTTFLIHFIVALLFGLGFLLIPVTVGSIYGLNIQEPETYQLLGGAMLGFAISSWLSSKAAYWESVRIVVVMEFVWTTLGTLVMLYVLLFTDFPALAWINVVIFAAFAIVFGRYYFQK